MVKRRRMTHLRADLSASAAPHHTTLNRPKYRDYDLALRDYDVAIRLDPAQPAYYAERSSCLLAKNECRQAIASADQAIKLQPKLADAYLCRGNAYSEAGDYASAV